MRERNVVILSARNCRRSGKLVEYLKSQGIPFTRIALESMEGRALAEQHQMRALPGILIDGVSVNPLDVLIPGECRVDQEAANRWFATDPTKQNRKPPHVQETTS